MRNFCETVPMDFFSSPNLFVPVIRSLRIRTFHLSPIRLNVVSTGHAGNSYNMNAHIGVTVDIRLYIYSVT